MKTLLIFLVLLINVFCIAQINIIVLNDVPDSFKQKYFSHKRDYNPLHIGNVWQYYFDDSPQFYATTKVVKDSIINGRKYYKKITLQVDFRPQTSNFISWERNDTLSGVSFMLDFQDVNENGDSLEELPIDSIELPFYTRYSTYKYSFYEGSFYAFYPGPKTTLILDTLWLSIEGDTVVSRYQQIEPLFWGEDIADKIGMWSFWQESPSRILTGAIINGKQYGTIVNVDLPNSTTQVELNLFNNYPNPFNPSTTLNFFLPDKNQHGNSYYDVKLIVYDVLGRLVTTLIDEYKPSGKYSVVFNAKGLTSGVYYYSLITDSKTITKPMIFIK